MTEVEKMRSSQLADMAAPELQVRFEHAKKLLARMRGMSTYDAGYRELLEELVPEIPETSIICPPFHCVVVARRADDTVFRVKECVGTLYDVTAAIMLHR